MAVSRRLRSDDKDDTSPVPAAAAVYQSSSSSSSISKGGLKKKNNGLAAATATATAAAALILLCLVLTFKTNNSNSNSNNNNSSSSSLLLRSTTTTKQEQKYHFYQPDIPTNVAFPETCPQQIQTYHIQNGKVQWIAGSYSYLTRGMSMHCLLARAAKRLGPTFETRIRIGTADMDLKSQLSFQPAETDQIMKNSSSSRPFLFPDSTFESWPEVHDYSLPTTIKNVIDAAHFHGLPGTTEWKTNRNPKIVWRGSPHGKERLEMMNCTTLDVQATSVNLTKTGLKLTGSNQISRMGLCEYRFVLHMNGIFNNRYSSAVKWKLLCGSLVFVPTAPLYVEWWNYNVWQPNVHYVPYTSLPDLLQQVDYYSNHLDEAAIIAKAGMELAQEAFHILPEWIDDTLTRYAAATNDKPQRNCPGGDPNKKRPGAPILPQSGFKSLEDLQRDYGPTVCSSAA